MANAGKKVFAMSETQKIWTRDLFQRQPFRALEGETQQEIESLNVPFDQAPRMKAAITNQAVAAIQRSPMTIRINIANGDMVGHTGNYHH